MKRLIAILVAGLMIGALAAHAKLPAAPAKSDAEKKVDADKAFKLTGGGEVVGVGAPQAGFEFGPRQLRIQGLFELLKIVGGRQLPFAPQPFQ